MVVVVEEEEEATPIRFENTDFFPIRIIPSASGVAHDQQAISRVCISELLELILRAQRELLLLLLILISRQKKGGWAIITIEVTSKS